MAEIIKNKIQSTKLGDSGTEGIITSLSARTDTMEKALEENIAKVTDSIKELKSDRVSLITSLGVFVALFTFISIQVQIFNKLSNIFQMISMSSIFAGILSLFIVLLDCIGRSWVDSKASYKPMIIVIIISIGLIILGLWISNWSWELARISHN